MQQAVHADWCASLHSTARAGCVSDLGGTLCKLVLAQVLRDRVSQTRALTRSYWLTWSGRLFGAVHISISIVLVPRIDTVAFVALLVAGQILSSLIFDHHDLFDVPRHPVDLVGLSGALLLVIGVVLVRYRSVPPEAERSTQDADRGVADAWIHHGGPNAQVSGTLW